MSKAAEFIAKWEGCRLDPYHDIAGYPTIGFGHKLSDEKHADLSQWPSITREEALQQLDQHLAHFRGGVEDAAVVRYASRPLGEDQLTALTSFAFNLGLGALRRSKLLKLVRGWSANPETSSEAALVLEWCLLEQSHDQWKERVVEGLLDRRFAEVALFFGVSGVKLAP